MDNKERVKNKKKKFRKIVKWTKGKNISQYLISMSFVLFIMIVKVEFPERKVYWEEI